MTDRQFGLVLSMFMCSDPSSLDLAEDVELEEFLDEESQRRGYLDWIDAYHRIPR